jgi:hypothetical protein
LLNDTPGRGSQLAKTLFGDGRVEIAGGEMRISVPAKSMSIFAVN